MSPKEVAERNARLIAALKPEERRQLRRVWKYLDSIDGGSRCDRSCSHDDPRLAAHITVP